MSKNKAPLISMTLLAILLLACEEKDYCAYSATSCTEPNAADMDMGSGQPDLKDGCVADADCPILDNTTAQCLATGACIYTCQDGWADPDGMIQELGCTCDKSKSSCMELAVCGDGNKEGREECDDGVNNSDENPNTCRTSCKAPYCGDGVKDDGEDCDDGNNDNTDSCTTSCTACGNGVLDPGETCDDQQVPGLRGDGCSPTCQVETEWDFRCSETLPSTCWQEWIPSSEDGGITSRTVGVNEDHLFISAGPVIDNKTKILAYKRNSFGAWTHSYTLNTPQREYPIQSCEIEVTDDDLFCIQNSEIFLYERKGDIFTIQSEVAFNFPGEIRTRYIRDRYAIIKYRESNTQEQKLRIVIKDNFGWKSTYDKEIKNTIIKNSFYPYSITSQDEIIWSGNCPQSVSMTTCTYISTINDPENITLLPHPNPSYNLNIYSAASSGLNIYTYDGENIIYYKNSASPSKSTSQPTALPPGEQYIFLKETKDKVWLTQSQNNNPTVSELKLDGDNLTKPKTYSPPTKLVNNPYFTIVGTNSSHSFLTETTGTYGTSGSGIIFIVPK